jgi:tetratricopeptide (TPR) repeat protein
MHTRFNNCSTFFKIRASDLILLLALTGVIFAVYWKVTSYGFISYDDTSYVTENPDIQKGLSFKTAAWAFTTLSNANWHPLTWLSHMLDYDLYGLSPSGHHLTNLLLHAANTILIVILLYYATGQYRQGLFVAALFALHPLHIQSVAWVAERKDLLCAFFWIITLLLYSVFVRRRSVLFYLLSIVSYAMGLMAKPMLVTLPFVMLLWDYWPLGRFGNSAQSGYGAGLRGYLGAVVEKIPFIALSVGSSVITYYAQLISEAVVPVKNWSFISRIMNAAVSYVAYIVKMFWPDNLAIIYPLPHTVPLTLALAAGFLLTGISCLIFFFARRRYPYLLVGWLWYLGTLVPVIGIVQVGQQAMADRYTYMPLLGLFIMIAWGFGSLAENHPGRRLLLSSLAGLVLSALAVCTFIQLSYWKDSITLFSQAVKVVPGNSVACRILGNNLAKEGRTAEGTRYLAEALRIDPQDWIAESDLGLALEGKDRTAEAIYHYTRALTINPRFANAHFNLGNILLKTGKYQEAAGHYLEAIKAEPGRIDARANLGVALYKEGKPREAIEIFREVLPMYAGDAAMNYFLGLAYASVGSIEESIICFEKALSIKPDFPEARHNLEAALAAVRSRSLPSAGAENPYSESQDQKQGSQH